MKIRIFQFRAPIISSFVKTGVVGFIVSFLFIKTGTAQVCTGTPFITNNCISSSVSVGTQTVLAASYTWLKDGVIKKGPLAGDGGSISFNFTMNVLGDSGHYTIEKTVNGVTSCATNIQAVIIPLPVTQTLNGGGQLCNAGKSLSLSNSETDVSYELYKDGSSYFNAVNGIGGVLTFDSLYEPGTYSVKAYKNVCSGFGNSYIMFGNAIVSGPLNNPIVNFTTNNSANVSWVGSGNFILEYGLTGFIPGQGATAGAGGTILNSSSSPVNITGLNPGVPYDVYVRQLCSPGNYVFGSNYSGFTTDCSTLNTFPITQGFETTATNALPACWTGSFHTTSTNPGTGTKCLSGFSNSVVLLPRMNLSGTQRLKYSVRTNYYPSIYQVKISTTNNSLASFSTVLFTDTVSSQNYSERIINLSGYSGPVYIAIQLIDQSIYLDDFTIENIPLCGGASNLKVNNVSNTNANVSWAGTGTYIAEYGLAGFTPGNAGTAGTGGTIINNAISPVTINGLIASTAYDFYVRQNCTSSGGGYSANSPKANFTTFFTCSPIIISACSTVSVSITAGTGKYNFAGFYPNNSCGSPTSGKEIFYSFTPSASGVYYIDRLSSTVGGISYLYKAASSGCSNNGWIGLKGSGTIGKFAIGMLQAGVQYYILLDNENENAITQTFKICRANVGSGDFCNTSSLGNLVPAFSSKKEYLLDGIGNLIAELDFSAVSNAVGLINYSYYINTSGIVRHDGDNKEYLDREFKITMANQPANPIGVKLYFTNTELQSLINEPNDGVADVNSITDVNISQASTGGCGNTVMFSSLIPQTASGSYDVTASYIQFSTTDFSSFYLNGGSAGLSTSLRSICPDNSVSFSIYPLGAGYTYQWQVDNGTGFVNMNNVNNFSGVTTTTLSITNAPSFLYGYKFRCVATNGVTNINGNVFTLKFVMYWYGTNNENWLNPKNWSCGSIPEQYRIPDQYTDVVVDGYQNNYPVIPINIACRSLLISNNATVTVEPGVKIDIKGK